MSASLVSMWRTQSWRWRARSAGLVALAALGLCSVAGRMLASVAPKAGQTLSGLGIQSLASPMPLVFCRQGPDERFAFAHTLNFSFANGATATVPMDQALYASMRGPFEFRHSYTSAVSHGMIPPPVRRAALAHGFCGKGPLFDREEFYDLLQQAGAPPGERPRSIRVVSTPRRPTVLGQPFSFDVPCPP